MKHRLFIFLLAMVASVSSLFAQSGTCGDNLTWNLTNGVLVISGTGAMTDFNSTSDNPWYEYRDAIKSVIIGDGITSIGKGAFYNCSVLTSVTIGNSVKSIEQGAFQNCSGLPSIVIPNSVTSIEYGAFKGCTVLSSVTMGNSIKSLGDYAFENCSSLNSVTIPNSVTSIGYGAFGKCSGLASVTIGNSLTSIGNFAFYNCSGLTSVTNYATTPQTIDEYVFGSVDISSCTLQVPAGSVTAYKAASVWKDFGTIQAISGDTPCTPISGTCGGNLTWKLSCDSVLTISGTGAMADFNSASDIPWYEYRDAIKSIVISKGVTSIAGNAFQKCTNLTSVTIPTSVTSIGQVAFYECTALTSVKIPSSVTSIGMGAFTYCSGLTSITIPNSVRTIGQGAFGYCTGLKSVTIGSGITSIEHGLFGNCTSLTSVTIPNNVTSIGQVAFFECTSLTSVSIPNSVTSIGQGAFGYCSSLTSVTIPSSLTTIELETFEYCSSLTSIVIPDGVTSIGEWAFQSCTSLTSVTIPSSVTSIGDEVFSGCTALRSVTNYATTPQTIDEYVFDNVNISACTLYVPAGSLAAYKKATIWKDFGTIQAIGGNTPCLIASGTCGENLTWELSCDSVLTISGTGTMHGTSPRNHPWYEHRNAIKSVIICNSVTSIGIGAFSGCTGLTSVTIGNSVTSIGYHAFYNCSGLTSVTINSDAIMKNTSLGASFADIFGYQVKNYMIGNGVTSIGDYAFYGCSGLTSMTIPSSVTSIGEDAFLGCSGLTYIIIESETPPTLNTLKYGVFDDKNDCPIYVPCSAVNAYKSAWAAYAARIVASTNCTIRYTVTFKDWDGTVLKTEQVEEGHSATPPVNPTREGYTFTGWDKDFSKVQSDLIITAQYTQNQPSTTYYTVTFKDWDGTILKKQQVEKGYSASAPAAPTREGYTFVGWDKDFSNVQSDLIVTALYQNNNIISPFVGFEYTRSHTLADQIYSENLIQNINNVWLEEMYPKYAIHLIEPTEGGTFTMGGVIFFFNNSNPDKVGYRTYVQYIQPCLTSCEIRIPTVAGLHIKFTLVEACDSISVNGEIRDFVAGDNIITATGAEIIIKYMKGKPKISAIIPYNSIANTTYYTVTFKDWDGTILKKQQVEKGYSASAPAAPTREGYTFVGWDKDFSNVHSNMSIYALYEPNNEGIEDAQSDQVQNTKILRNGQIFIQRGEKIYTITGQEIQSY